MISIHTLLTDGTISDSPLYSRSKSSAEDNHPPRRRSGGAGTAQRRQQPYQIPPAGGKGDSKGTCPFGAVRAGPSAAQAK